MTKELIVRAYAKINWMLRVLGLRKDGYHEIETIFQAISLHDTLRVERARAFELRCDDPSIPVGEENLISRAFTLAYESFPIDAVRVTLEKRIPAQGGLGGGSSDAAAMLRALSVLFGIADETKLQEIAARIGSDVPFFLRGGVAYATSRGELLEELPAGPPIPVLLVVPKVRISTLDAYRWIDEDDPGRDRTRLGFERAREIASDGFLRHAPDLRNDFEVAVFRRFPELGSVKTDLQRAGAVWAGMSGSGSTIVGAFRDLAARDQAMRQLPDLDLVTATTN